MKNISSYIHRVGKLWIFGAVLSALIGLIHGVLTFFGFVEWEKIIMKAILLIGVAVLKGNVGGEGF